MFSTHRTTDSKTRKNRSAHEHESAPIANVRNKKKFWSTRGLKHRVSRVFTSGSLGIIKFSDIPEYLKTSKLYYTLLQNDQRNRFHIPVKFLKRDASKVNTLHDAKHLVKTLYYWDSPELPISLIRFSMRNEGNAKFQALIQDSAFLKLKQIAALNTVMHASNAYRTVAAASFGSVNMLKVLRERKFDWNEMTCEAAAQGGHLDCLRYAHENGCPWDKSTCEAAAGHGHLACLRYAHENGCPWDKSTCEAAEQGGHMQCLAYMRDNGGCV